MTQFLLKRLLMMVPLLLGITLVTFAVIHLAPGEPVEMQIAMNPKVTAEARERMRKFYGLDKPLHVQYINWVKRLAQLDFGRSLPLTTGRWWTRSRNGSPLPFPSISSP